MQLIGIAVENFMYRKILLLKYTVVVPLNSQRSMKYMVISAGKLAFPVLDILNILVETTCPMKVTISAQKI